MIVDAFYRGLKYNIRKVLIRQDQPKTLAEAISSAQKEELNQKILAEEELKISGKSRQESLENEQLRLCRELEKLKNQLNEKLNEEKINVVKTEQGCSNCNCNNPVPLSNIQAYPTNFMPYHLPHNNYNNFIDVNLITIGEDGIKIDIIIRIGLKIGIEIIQIITIITQIT
ncbi:unnamed protein product [Meloidogyne enterolobii]|uniref:Uncharacterized protein n=1 Tax=Meloidogyne enterolobii TaxID=390850 RepID=A0ACB0Y5D4_MELEN